MSGSDAHSLQRAIERLSEAYPGGTAYVLYDTSGPVSAPVLEDELKRLREDTVSHDVKCDCLDHARKRNADNPSMHGVVLSGSDICARAVNPQKVLDRHRFMDLHSGTYEIRRGRGLEYVEMTPGKGIYEIFVVCDNPVNEPAFDIAEEEGFVPKVSAIPIADIPTVPR